MFIVIKPKPVLHGFIIWLCLSFTIVSCGQNTQETKAAPGYVLKPVGWVSDYAGVLTPGQTDSLETAQQQLEDSTGSQIAILIIDSLPGIPLEEYTLNTFNTWGVGRKDINDGILIVVAIFNRQMRIGVGYGLEKIITDEIAGQIIQEEMVPPLQQQNYFEGLLASVERIKQLIYQNQPLVGQRK